MSFIEKILFWDYHFGDPLGGNTINIWCRSQRSEPARRRLRQRPASAWLHQAEDSGAGSPGSEAVWHLQDTPGLQWLRLQDTRKVRHGFISQQIISRIIQILWDRINQAPSHWGVQASGGHARRGGEDIGVQARVSQHLRLGDQGQAPFGGGLQCWQCAKCEYLLISLFLITSPPTALFPETESHKDAFFHLTKSSWAVTDLWNWVCPQLYTSSPPDGQLDDIHSFRFLQSTEFCVTWPPPRSRAATTRSPLTASTTSCGCSTGRRPAGPGTGPHPLPVTSGWARGRPLTLHWHTPSRQTGRYWRTRNQVRPPSKPARLHSSSQSKA